MQERSKSCNEKFSVDVVKMIRNNNIVISMENIEDYDTYFMLDYFDILFHRNLAGDEKIYREFWDISDDQEKKTVTYKAAYKTLSLYADKKAVDRDFFKITVDTEKEVLSSKPFLGIIQVNLVYYKYGQEPLAEQTLSECEKQVLECLEKNSFRKGGEVCYQIHRSSTSGDFCLVVKSAHIQNIYIISSMINNHVFSYNEETYKFSTYTNIGIDCYKDKKGRFWTFQKETVANNSKCRFALRFTTNNVFAKILFKNITAGEEDMRVVIEPMEGLFGRYDFLVQLSMEDFSKLYAILCESKMIGSRSATFSETGDKFLDSFQKGVVSGEIEIINERVLVPLPNGAFADDSADIIKDDLKEVVEKVNIGLRNKVEEFRQMINLFVEERRAFIDVSRELEEVISTYVPQGVEKDSHVNWQILVSDLKVVFEGIEVWKKSYGAEADSMERKAMRVQFLGEIRLIAEALNQYYKFLQNVNAQTWQAPLYEIQTQLDAEKMMIAYREFLYQYLHQYKEYYKDSADRRPMRYPVIYPNLSDEIVNVVVAFQNQKDLYKQLFVCKVPSFEYFGRMFDMIPWSLHEASHCIRVLPREERNEYLIRAVFREIFSQALYKLLNHYSNDYGYHDLGELENEILECIVRSASTEFKVFCEEQHKKAEELALSSLETELLEFLYIIFEQNIDQLEREADVANVEEIQNALLRYLGKLGLLDSEKPEKGSCNWKDMLKQSVDQADMLFMLLKEIYNAFYKQMTDAEPEEGAWEVITLRGSDFEEGLRKVSEILERDSIGPEQRRDYCFSMRELNRLYGAWLKRRKNRDNGKIWEDLWRGCICDIRDKVKKGFYNDQGFPELYRILNMVFENEGAAGNDEVRRIGKEFDRLFQEEVYVLTERVVKLYRESIADTFMAGALGLDAFGYCRNMFQTASDASIKNSVNWTEAVNIYRFRLVAAILLGRDPDVKVSEVGHEKKIPMEILLEKGERYCYSTLDCAKEKINAELKKKDEKEKENSLNLLFEMLANNIKDIFKCFTQPLMVIRELLEDSVLALLIDPERFDGPCEEEIAKKRKKVKAEYEIIRDEIKKSVYIFYRVKCFISILELVGRDGYIVVKKDEYEHLDKIYGIYLNICKETTKDEICKVISQYYNDPRSARDKSSAAMLEDTLRFIQTYYYRNRFKIMSSLKEDMGEEKDEKTDWS